LSTVKIQPQSGTFRASGENNNCRLPSIEKKTQKAVLIISLQPSKARRNAHAAQRRCAGGGGDASRPASASAASKGLEAPTTLPGPPQCWASAPPEGRMADQVGHAARRAPLPAQMRGDLRVPPRRCRVQRIRGGVRARVRRVWALVPRGRRGARMLELVRCAVTGARRLAIRMRGLSARSRETLALAAPLPSEAGRQTIPARIQKCEKKGVRPRGVPFVSWLITEMTRDDAPPSRR
jgi:hypothetical protein